MASASGAPSGRPAGPVSIQEACFQLQWRLPWRTGGLISGLTRWPGGKRCHPEAFSRVDWQGRRRNRHGRHRRGLGHLRQKLGIGAAMRTGGFVMIRRLHLVARMACRHAVGHLHGCLRRCLRHVTSTQRLLCSKEQGKTCQKDGAKQLHDFQQGYMRPPVCSKQLCCEGGFCQAPSASGMRDQLNVSGPSRKAKRLR